MSNQSLKFGLITEGITDQIVIEDILNGYFKDQEIEVSPLQPDINRDKFGNWLNVFNYCKSPDFQQALQFNDYLVIQIDTDVSEEAGYDVLKSNDDGNLLTVEELIEKVKDKFIHLIGIDFCQKYHQRLIFAISVHSLECWLLPLYYTDKNKQKINNCLNSLNQALQKQENFSIDPSNKLPKYYRRISKAYCKKKTLLKFASENPSFKIFVESLESVNLSPV